METQKYLMLVNEMLLRFHLRTSRVKNKHSLTDLHMISIHAIRE